MNDMSREPAPDTRFEMVDGRLFDPLRPDPEAIGIDAIATVLSNSCRFGGHIEGFYSTAQHSVLVAFLAPRDAGAQRYALLHDADEAFGLPDMLTMLKPVFPDFVFVQAMIAKAIEHRFDLEHEDHARIKPADRQALVLEKSQMKKCLDRRYWHAWTDGVPALEGIKIDLLPPKNARELFLDAHEQIFLRELPVDADFLASRAGFKIDPDLLRGPLWLEASGAGDIDISPC